MTSPWPRVSLTVRRQRRDTDGDVTGLSEDTVYPGWLVAPAGSSEQADGTRDSTTDRAECYGGPLVVDIVPGDRAWLDTDPRQDAQGRDLDPPWQVDGTPARWSRLGGEPGWVVTLQRHRS